MTKRIKARGKIKIEIIRRLDMGDLKERRLPLLFI
jgi:hypothetical protein